MTTTKQADNTHLNLTDDFPICSVRQDEFAPAIKGLYKSVDPRHANPVFHLIGLRAQVGQTRVELFATDGATIQRLYCPAKVDRSGVALMDGKTLYDLVPLLSPERMDFAPTTFETTRRKRYTLETVELPAVQLLCGAARVRLVADTPISDFPALPDGDAQHLGEVEYRTLKELVAHLYRFRDGRSHNSRYQTIYVLVENGALTLTATDGYSVARAVLSMADPRPHESVQAAIDSKTLRDALYALAVDHPERVSIGWITDTAAKDPMLQLSSPERDVLVRCRDGALPVPEPETRFQATLDGVADVASFLKGRGKESTLRVAGQQMALDHDVNGYKALDIDLSVPLENDIALKHTHVANVYYTFQQFKKWGETCEFAIEEWTKAGSLALAAETNGHRLMCWFSLLEEEARHKPAWLK